MHHPHLYQPGGWIDVIHSFIRSFIHPRPGAAVELPGHRRAAAGRAHAAPRQHLRRALPAGLRQPAPGHRRNGLLRAAARARRAPGRAQVLCWAGAPGFPGPSACASAAFCIFMMRGILCWSALPCRVCKIGTPPCSVLLMTTTQLSMWQRDTARVAHYIRMV